MWTARARAVEQGGVAAILDMVMGRYFSPGFREHHPEIVEPIARQFLATPVEGYLGCCDAIAELDFTLDLPQIHARTLVIAGTADAGTPPAMAQAIASHVPGAHVALIADAAHLSPMEKPIEFARLVRGFLQAP